MMDKSQRDDFSLCSVVLLWWKGFEFGMSCLGFEWFRAIEMSVEDVFYYSVICQWLQKERERKPCCITSAQLNFRDPDESQGLTLAPDSRFHWLGVWRSGVTDWLDETWCLLLTDLWHHNTERGGLGRTCIQHLLLNHSVKL